jgi:predicted nucleic acid-binding protein
VIVLDTNVISELLVGSRADPLVLTWVRSLREQPVTTALNRAELLAGAAALPDGRRRTELIEGISRFLAGLDITLPFSTDCAGAYAELRETRRRAGRPISTMDALIASIALVHDAAIATRDAAGFAGLGLDVVDPWKRGGR